ncbi:MAG: SPW repeat protein [Methyloceanibacter sp.]
MLSASLGVWLVISPWITGVSTHPDIVLQSVIAGALLAVLSLSGISVANT